MFPTVSIYADKRCERTAAEELPTSIKAFHFINIHRLETETLFLGPLKLFSSSRSLGGGWSRAGDAQHHRSWCPHSQHCSARSGLPGNNCQGTTSTTTPVHSPTQSHAMNNPRWGSFWPWHHLPCWKRNPAAPAPQSGSAHPPPTETGDADTGTLQTASATAENRAAPSRLNSRALKSCFLPLQIICL